jgi:hypothetical protein
MFSKWLVSLEQQLKDVIETLSCESSSAFVFDVFEFTESQALLKGFKTTTAFPTKPTA